MGATEVLRVDVILVLQALAWVCLPEHVVLISLRRYVKPVSVQVGCIRLAEVIVDACARIGTQLVLN